MGDYKYKETGEKMIGSIMKMHGAMGNGFQEVIYQRALENAWRIRNLSNIVFVLINKCTQIMVPK